MRIMVSNLLQIDSMSLLDNSIKSIDIPIVETIIVIGIIILQLYISFQIILKIRNFSNIFHRPLTLVNGYVDKVNFRNNRENLEDYLIFKENGANESLELIADKNVVVIPYVNSVVSIDNEITRRIITVLNSYLINNFGAIVNFSIIKDILEREVDLEDSEITNYISTPLYLGLAATMLGVIMGLFAMPNFNDADNTQILIGVSPLINGVKMAMFASLTGLLCTTILSSFIYKHAKTKVNLGMNSQISYFQNKLLPVLIKAEDTGVSGLKSSLDKFGRETTKILEDLHGAVDKTRQTLTAQLQVITKVEELNFTKVSKVNLDLFDRLESNMEAFTSFSQYLNQIEKVSGNLSGFAERTDDFKKIADSVNLNLNESKQLTLFLTSHLEAIKSSGSSALNAFNIVDSKFSEAIDKLSKEVDNRTIILNENSAVLNSSLIDTFNNIGDQIQKVAKDHLEVLSKSYSDSMPEFKYLEELKSLPALKENMDNQLIALKEVNLNITKLLKNSSEKSLTENETKGKFEPDKTEDKTITFPEDEMNSSDAVDEKEVKKPWYKFW